MQAEATTSFQVLDRVPVGLRVPQKPIDLMERQSEILRFIERNVSATLKVLAEPQRLILQIRGLVWARSMRAIEPVESASDDINGGLIDLAHFLSGKEVMPLLEDSSAAFGVPTLEHTEDHAAAELMRAVQTGKINTPFTKSVLGTQN